MGRSQIIWLAALVALDLAAYRLVPSARAAYDFTKGNTVTTHIVDRALTPIPIVQNTSEAWPLLLAVAIAYLVAYAAYEAMCRSRMLSAKSVWLALALGGITMLFVPYLPTSDPYAYALYGLEAGPLDLSPYVPQAFDSSHSPWASALLGIFPDSHAYARTCNYGPVFVFVYASLALVLMHAPLLAYLIAERLLGVLALAIVAFILMRADRDTRGVNHAARFVLHPLVITEFVAFAHGDVVMFALLAAAYFAWRRGWFGGAAALCVLSVGVRSVAVLALAALLLYVLRLRPRAIPASVAGAFVAGLAMYVSSRVLLGGFSLGGEPIFNALSAPGLALASMLGLRSPIAIGVTAQAALGATIALLLARRWWEKPKLDALAWWPWAALAAGPSIYPHYLTWTVAVASLHESRRMRFVTAIGSVCAPLLYLTHMNVFPAPGPPREVYIGVLAILWVSVILALAYRSEARLVAQPAMTQATG